MNTRSGKMGCIEEEESSRSIDERLARQNEDPSPRSTTTDPTQRVVVVDRDTTVAALEREMSRISAQLSRFSANTVDDAANNGNIAINNNKNYSAEEEALRSLQTPSSLRDLTTFDGNPLKLSQFIKAVDRIMPLMEKIRNTPTFDVWMQSIRAKIIGEADTILELYGTELEWDEMKANLITHYSDKRDEYSLTMDLFHTKQTGSVQQFYEQITHIVSLLVNQLTINERDPNIRMVKLKDYQAQGLKVFLAGLLPPTLGSTIRSQNPTSLKETHRFCQAEDNIADLQRALPSNAPNMYWSNSKTIFESNKQSSV